MKTLITYSTGTGTTGDFAELLAKKITLETKVVNIKEIKNIDISEFDTVVIGGSVHAGKISGSVKSFCINNNSQLLQKKLGFFVCCKDKDYAEQAMKECYPEDLIKHSVGMERLGYELNPNKLNFLQRFIINMISKKETGKKLTETEKEVAKENIDKLASAINNA